MLTNFFIKMLYMKMIDRARIGLIVRIFRLAQIKSFIYGFHFGASDKKIVKAALRRRGLLSKLASLLLRGSASREDFNFPLGFEKAVGTPPQAGPARFISVSWDGEADLVLTRPPLSLANPITAANKLRWNVSGNVYILKWCYRIFQYRKDYVNR